MEHVDFKDMPVAAGLTLVTAGLVLAFVLEPPRTATLAGVSLAGSGGAVAVATRPSSIVLLVALVGGTLAVAVLRGRSPPPDAHCRCRFVIASLAVGPRLRPRAHVGDEPDRAHRHGAWLHDSIDVARNYPWDVGPIRTAGQDLRSIDLPWWYVPAWLGAQLPLLTFAALVGGVAVARRRA